MAGTATTDETVTAAVLATLPAGWFVRHDLRWPGRPAAGIDHVVVGPAGIFVIDTESWSGPEVLEDGVLRRETASWQTPVAVAAEAALAVARLVPDFDLRLVRPVICFVGEEDLRGWTHDVALATTGNLVELVTTAPAVLAPDVVRRLARDLDRQLCAATEPGDRARQWRQSGPALVAATPRTGPAPMPPRVTRRTSRSVGSRLVLTAVMAATLVGLPSLAHTALVVAR